MQQFERRLKKLEGQLLQSRQQVRALADRISVVEDQIDSTQCQLEHANSLLTPDEVTNTTVQDQDQRVARLWQELSRLGQKEDRLRQEKVLIVQTELTLYEALLHVQVQIGQDEDVEGARNVCTSENPTSGPQYCLTVRLIPPFLTACFLISLFAWFGVDVQKSTQGLSTTQKIASIGSASFTIMTMVALFVRAAMCTGEWQWMLQTCYQFTECRWLQPQVQATLQQRTATKEKLPVMAAGPLPFEASSVFDAALNTVVEADTDKASLPSSPSSMDSSMFEELKKQS